MVPINEVLIAKIVLGYLTSRDLSTTADCFVKECEGFRSSNDTGICEKERILNHLEGLNLLPSLEDILKDYFAYEEPDEHLTDKVYMLWKQLDVVIGQLRAITLGKTKSKAFMNSRRAPKTYNKLFDKTEHNNPVNANQYVGNGGATYNNHIADLLDTQKVTQKDTVSTNFVLPVNDSAKTHRKLVTPIKDSTRQSSKKQFRSPRRKPRHPKRNANGDACHVTEENVRNIPTDVPTDAHLNKEFSDLVAALISNDRLSVKLADNINKVVSVEPKTPCKENEDIVDEIIKLTEDDPDLNVLFSMLVGQPHHPQESVEPSVNHFNVNTAIASTSLDIGSSASNVCIELQPTVNSTANEQIEVVDSNLQSTITDIQPLDTSNSTQIKSLGTNLQSFLMPTSSYPNFFELFNTDYGCMRDINEAFSTPLQTPYEQVPVSESTNVTEETSTLMQISPNVSLSGTHKNDKLTSTTARTDVPLVDKPAFENVDGKINNIDKVLHIKNTNSADDNEILASHALLQLSTSPMKISKSSCPGNVISKPAVSPQALASNRKISREPICSTNHTVQSKFTNKSDFVMEAVPHVNQITLQNISPLDCKPSDEVSATQQQLSLGENKMSPQPVEPNKNNNKKRMRKNGSKSKNMSAEIAFENSGGKLHETEDAVHKKTKRSREILAKQLDFNPQASAVPLNKGDQSKSKVIETKVFNPCISEPSMITPTYCSLKLPVSTVANIHPKISIPSKYNLQSPTLTYQGSCQNSIDAKVNILPVTEHSQVASDCSPLKSDDEYHTFRIKGNAISKLKKSCDDKETSIISVNPNPVDESSCKSKTLSMVISNTDSLSKLFGGVSFTHALSSTSKKSHLASVSSSSPLNAISIQPSHSNCTVATCNSSGHISVSHGKEDPIRLCGTQLEKSEGGLVVLKSEESAVSRSACGIIEENRPVISKSANDRPETETTLICELGHDSASKIDENDDEISKSHSVPSKKKVKCSKISKTKSGTVPSGKRVKCISSKKVISNSVKRKEKLPLISKPSKNITSKKMTVKFNFPKSPLRKKVYLDGKSTSTVDVKGDANINDARTLEQCNNLTHNVFVESKEIAIIKDTPIFSNTTSSCTGNVSGDKNLEKLSIDCLKAPCIQLSLSNESARDTLDKENLITSNSTDINKPFESSHTSSCDSQSLQGEHRRKDRSNVLLSSAERKKAKRKRKLSMLMLNVDNVAQLLSGIDYS